MKGFLSQAVMLALLIVTSAPVAIAQQDAPSDDDKQFQAVADRYWKILQRRPRRDTAFDLWYRHYLDAGRLDELSRRIEEQAAASPKDAAAQLLRGLVHERRGNNEQALMAYDRAAELSPDNYYPHYLRATLLVRLKRPGDAISAMTQAVSLEPPRGEALDIYKRLARLQLEQQKTSEALKTTADMLEAFPDDRQVLEELAQLLADQQQYGEALERWEQLAALAADDPYQQIQARIEIAAIKTLQGKASEAVDLLEGALDQARPDSWLQRDIRRRIEQSLRQDADISALAEWCRQRLVRRPQDLATMLQLAAALRQAGQLDDAIAQYERAVELAPSRRDLRESLIDAQTAAGLIDAARAQCELLADQHPQDADVLRRLGELHLQAGSETDLLAAQEKAIAIWKRISQSGDARSALVVAETCRQASLESKHRSGAAQANGNSTPQSPLLAVAEEHYRLAIERAPNEPQYREYLGEFLHSQNRRQEAIRAWRFIAVAPQETAESWQRLAEVYAGFDYLDEAVAAAQQAVKRKPADFALRDFCLGLLIKQRDYTAALIEASQLERLADDAPSRDKALRRHVEVHSAAGTVDREIARLETVVSTADASLEQRWLLSLLLADQWRFAEAARHLEAALADHGEQLELRKAHADALKQSGDLTSAVAQYQRLAKVDPRSRFAHYQQIVRLQLQRGDAAAARQAADELVKLAPASLEGYRVRADVAFRLKDDEGGLRHLRQAVRLAPRDLDLRSRLARALAERGQQAEALEHYWTSFERSEELSDRLPLVQAMAEVAARSGKRDELWDQLRRLRARQDDPKMLTICLAEALVRLERDGDAQRELLTLLDRRGDDADVLRQLASIAEQQGAWPAAVGYQQRLVALDERRTNLETLARFLSENGEAEPAARIWQRLLEEANDDSMAATVVDRKLEQDRVEEALAVALLSLQKHPQSWRLLLRAGLAQLSLGQYEQAKVTYNTLLGLEATPQGNMPDTMALAVAVDSRGSTAASSANGSAPSNRSTSAAYALTTTSALEHEPAFARSFSDTPSMRAPEETFVRLARSIQIGSLERSQQPQAKVRGPGQQKPKSGTGRVDRSVASDFASARLEAMSGLLCLAVKQREIDRWITAEIAAGQSDSPRLRLAVLTGGLNSILEQAERARLLETLIQTRPDDPLPHLIRLYGANPTGRMIALMAQGFAGPLRNSPGPIQDKQQYLDDLEQSFAWLARRRPAEEQDLGYYYLLRLNDLGEAVRAAEWIENRLQLARTFDDLGALPRAILSGDDSHLVRMLIARSADLAAEPRLPSAAVPYLIAVLEHFLASSKYTDDADLAPMMAILEAYLALDETRGDVGWTTRSTVSQSGSSQAAMGKLPVDGTQLKAQLEAVEMQLAAARAQQSHPSIIQALTRMREKRLAELREARGEPIPFPSPNGYLDSPKFQLLQQFAQRAIRLRRHSELVERLSEKGKSQLGSAPLRYQIAAAFTLWWTGDKAAAVARLEALCRQHEQDEILDVTLAHAYYSQQDLRRALAIVERMKNPDPSVAQAVANLRREIRHYYSDLAKLRDLKGHTHVVRSIAFSPDGASLLSGSYDRSLKIWEVKSGKCLQSLTGHTDLVLSVAWSPTGQRIASGSYDEIRIWDVASARCLHAIKSAGAVRSLAFSPDGQRLAAAGDDQTVRLWNVETGGEAASLAGHAERVFGIAFSPDGKMLASASGDKTVRLWNAASGQLIDTLTGHSASISCLAFAPDGRWLATGSDDNNVMLWRIGENQAYATLERHADAIYAVAFSPDGKRLASGGADRSIKLWTLGGDGEPATLLGHHNTVASLAFSPDGKALASSGYDEMVKLWTLSAMPGNEQAQAADPSPTAK